MPQCQFLFSVVFVFQKSCTGNILGTQGNKSRSSYFHVTKTESEGETKTSHMVATPGLGAASPGPAPRGGVGPLASTSLAPPRIYSPSRENPRHPSTIPRKVPSRPSSPTLVREGSEVLLGTLSEREIITGGFYIAMPASEVMRE